LLLHHSREGALGLVINRPSGLNISELLSLLGRTEVDEEILSKPILFGGPVGKTTGWVVFESDHDSEMAIKVEDGLYASGTLEVFKKVVAEGNSKRFAFFIGYSGWGPMQLDSELEAGAWMPAKLDRHLIFERPFEERWHKAFLSLGIDPRMWVSKPGVG
jgi:putative transcriptional regulator